MATKAAAESTTGVLADSLVLERYSTRADFTYDLTDVSRLPVLGKVLPYLVLAWALIRYDRFHFFYNRGILAQIEPGQFNRDELELIRNAGRQVFFWAYGADVRDRTRTLALGEPNCCSACPAIGSLCVCDTATAEQNVRFIHEMASGCATMGDMAAYTPDAIDDVFYWPVDLGADRGRRFRTERPAERDHVVVAHAPNNPRLKGTKHLEAAVETLGAEGLDIRLDLISGVANDEVLDRFRRADIIFDQCMIGFHGYTALEAMAVERPVICYLRDPDRDLVAPDQCPIVNATPTELTTVLRSLATDHELRMDLGRRGRSYVADHHSLAAVGRRIDRFTSTSSSPTSTSKEPPR